MRVFVVLAVVACSPAAFSAIEANARRGAEFFEKQKCNTCHAVGSRASASSPAQAPDLAARGDRDYTPSAIASRMWNHAPAMWSQIAQQGITTPTVSEQDAADLFAFFYSARYFEKPGDAARGKRAFSQKKCAGCHAVANGQTLEGPPVGTWQSLRDPVALAQRMWNHQGQMEAAADRRKIAWPELAAQDLTDILVYLQTLPGQPHSEARFEMQVGANGQQIFESKGCVNCHKAALALEARLAGQTLTDIAASMWNHAPRMKQPGIQLSEDEMRQLLAYLWGNQFFSAKGNATRGRRVFESKRCGTCHGQGDAPKIEGNPQFSDIAMVSALWKHGPQMLATLKQKNMAWPELTPGQMADLVAYLASPRGN